jgi:hypothetical protein
MPAAPYLPTFQRHDQHHALFVARVVHQPFGDLAQHTWDNLEYPTHFQLLDRQERFLAGLATIEPFTVELRYLRRAQESFVDCVLVGKASDAEATLAQQAALALWHRLVALIPVGYGLQPATTQPEFQEWGGYDLAAELPLAQWAEIRRYAEFMPWLDERLPMRQLPVVYPYAWRLTGWESVWTAMTRVEGPALIVVNVRPAVIAPAAQVMLADVVRDLRALAQDTQPPLSQLAAQAADCNQALFAANFETRVLALGAPGVREALRAALSGPGDLVGQGAAGAVPLANVYAEAPTPEQFETLRNNFFYLEQTAWGSGLGAPFDQLATLTTPATTLCAFRLPLLPPGGLPGLTVGAEFDAAAPSP